MRWSWCIALLSLWTASLQASALQTPVDLFPYLSYLEDKSASLSFDQVQALDSNYFIKPTGNRFIAQDADAAIYWIKIDLRAAATMYFDQEPILYLPYREITSLTYYKPLAEGGYHSYQVGRKYGLTQKDVPSPHMAFSSDQQGWQQAPIYFRVDYRDYAIVKTLPVFLYPESVFTQKSILLSIIAAAMTAVFFTVIIYTTAFCIAIREKFLVLYLIYLMSAWVMCIASDGIWSTWIIRSNDDMASRLLDAITIAGCICVYVAFISEIMQVKKIMPWIIPLTQALYVYGAIATCAHLAGLDMAQHPWFSKEVAGVIALCFTITIFVVAIYKKMPYAKVLAPASYSPVVFGGIYSAYLSGDMGYNPYVSHAISTGFVLEILIISVVVSLITRNLLRNKEAAYQKSQIAIRTAAESARLTEEKSRFIAHVGHDMRQPLYVLRLQLTLLKIKITDTELSRTIAAMSSSINSIEAMFDDILYMSQLEAGSIVPEKNAVSVAGTLQTISMEFSQEAEKRGIRLAIYCNSSAQINTDKQILKRILRNLVQNALRHTESGGVLIGCRRRGKGYRIDVIDTGSGINKTDQENLFKPLHKTTGEKILDSNLGLGLSIVATLSQLIGATVDVSSIAGKGSRFSIYLAEATAD